MKTFAFLLVTIGTSGCGSTEIATTSFDRQCAVATDCVSVYEGDLCAACRIDNAAINAAELQRYEAEARSLSKNCLYIGEARCDGGGQLECNGGECSFVQ